MLGWHDSSCVVYKFKFYLVMEDFVTFEIAKKLKEKGFKDNCIGYYDYEGEFHYNYESAISNKEIYFCHNKYDNIWHRDLVDAPTISQVLKWLREEKDIMVFPLYSKNTSKWYCSIINADSLDSHNLSFDDSYEEAALAGIEYVIDNLP